MTGQIPLAAVPVKAPPANTIAVWPKAHPLIAETEDGARVLLVDLAVFDENDVGRIDLSQVELVPQHWVHPAIKLAAAFEGPAAELGVSGGVWLGGDERIVHYRGPPPGHLRANLDHPDRPLLRLLNHAHGAPVLVACGRPGNHDPAHVAAGRLPARFHRHSDVRLWWCEFPGGHCRAPAPATGLRSFAAAILVTNVGKPFVDPPIEVLIEAIAAAGRPVLWGEAAPDGAVAWHEDFAVGPVFERGLLRCDIRRLEAEG